MNNKKAKKIRSIISPENEISRRTYRRAKKIYTRLPEHAKNDFLEGLQKMIGS